MAYTVEQFKKDNIVIVSKIQEFIDKELQQKGSSYIDLSNWTKYVAQQDVLAKEIVKIYKNAGWDVKYDKGSDYRETWNSITINTPKELWKQEPQ